MAHVIMHSKVSIPPIAFAVEESTIIGEDLVSRDLRVKNLFFGTGLCTPTEMSSGLPFDSMEFIYCCGEDPSIIRFS